MYEIKITNLSCDYKQQATLTRDVHTMIYNKLMSLKINTLSASKTLDQLSYTIGDKQIFISANKNRIKMTATDPRRKTIGRDYLETHKVNEEQWKGAVDTFTKCFERLRIKATVSLYKNGALVDTWHQDGVTMAIEKPTKFPQKGW